MLAIASQFDPFSRLLAVFAAVLAKRAAGLHRALA
jgi:hypothetical protein